MKVTGIFHRKLNSACDSVRDWHHFLCWIFPVFSYSKNFSWKLCLELRNWSCKSTSSGLFIQMSSWSLSWEKKVISVCFSSCITSPKGICYRKCPKSNNEAVISLNLSSIGINSYVTHISKNAIKVYWISVEMHWTHD